MYTVIVNRPRPDFRVFIDLLYGPDTAVDSDGDSDPVWSREWHDLYLRARESDAPKVEIYAAPETPDKFGICSEDYYLTELAAFYLFLHCGDRISKDGKSLTQSDLETFRSKYALEIKRAEASIWHNSSDDCPYPNLGAS